jgi:hypothetical protein
VRDLFDSIYNQYPIGSFLFWVPTTRRRTSEALGPLQLPDGSGDLLVIDGQQRLAALAGVLLAGQMPLVVDVEDPDMWALWFDGSDELFKHLDDRPVPSSCIAVADLLDINAIMDAAGRLAGLASARQIVSRWQAVAAAFGSYRFPIVEFRTDELTIAVQAFTRLNRRGLAIAPDEMFSALTDDGGEAPTLTDHIDQILSRLAELGMGVPDRITVLRLFFLELELDPFRTDWNRLDTSVQEKTQTRLAAVADTVEGSLRNALAFLFEELHLPHLRLLPYTGILIGVAAQIGPYRQVDGANAEGGALAYWCWHSAFVGFAEGNPSRATAVWREMRRRREGLALGLPIPTLSTEAVAAPFPSRHNVRAARVLANLWAQVRDADLDAEARRDLGRRLESRGAAVFRALAPRTRGASSARLRDLLASPANRALDIPSSGVSQVPLSDEGWETFLELRLTDLIQRERAFLQRHGLPLPASIVPARPAIDRETGDDSALRED